MIPNKILVGRFPEIGNYFKFIPINPILSEFGSAKHAVKIY